MASTAAKPLLHSYWRSSCSWRVRIALYWKKIDFEYRAVNLAKGEHLTEEYGKINPTHEIPTLEIDGHALIQSVSILEYLDESRPERPLYPKDPYQRALVRQVVNIIAADIQPLQNMRVLNYAGGDSEEKKAEWARHWIDYNFQGLEKLLKRISGKYCVGDEVTAADCCLVPQLYGARRYKVDVSQFPTILRIEKSLNELPEFQDADAMTQPDTVKKAK